MSNSSLNSSIAQGTDEYVILVEDEKRLPNGDTLVEGEAGEAPSTPPTAPSTPTTSNPSSAVKSSVKSVLKDDSSDGMDDVSIQRHSSVPPPAEVLAFRPSHPFIFGGFNPPDETTLKQLTTRHAHWIELPAGSPLDDEVPRAMQLNSSGQSPTPDLPIVTISRRGAHAAGFADALGKRPQMEDRAVMWGHFTAPVSESSQLSEASGTVRRRRKNTNFSSCLYGVFDGHGGARVAELAAEWVPRAFLEELRSVGANDEEGSKNAKEREDDDDSSTVEMAPDAFAASAEIVSAGEEEEEERRKENDARPTVSEEGEGDDTKQDAVEKSRGESSSFKAAGLKRSFEEIETIDAEVRSVEKKQRKETAVSNADDDTEPISIDEKDENDNEECESVTTNQVVDVEEKITSSVSGGLRKRSPSVSSASSSSSVSRSAKGLSSSSFSSSYSSTTTTTSSASSVPPSSSSSSSSVPSPPSADEIKRCFVSAFMRTNERLLGMPGNVEGGSTGLMCLVEGDHLHVANCGDCRAVLVRVDARPLRLTVDHKADSPAEISRIRLAGGFVARGRVCAILAVSRAFGNRFLQPVISAEPDVFSVDWRELQGKSVILACDGVWDVMEDAEVSSLAHSAGSPGQAAKLIRDTALARGTADNVTCLVINLLESERHEEKMESVASSSIATVLQSTESF